MALTSLVIAPCGSPRIEKYAEQRHDSVNNDRGICPILQPVFSKPLRFTTNEQPMAVPVSYHWICPPFRR